MSQAQLLIHFLVRHNPMAVQPPSCQEAAVTLDYFERAWVNIHYSFDQEGFYCTHLFHGFSVSPKYIQCAVLWRLRYIVFQKMFWNKHKMCTLWKKEPLYAVSYISYTTSLGCGSGSIKMWSTAQWELVKGWAGDPRWLYVYLPLSPLPLPFPIHPPTPTPTLSLSLPRFLSLPLLSREPSGLLCNTGFRLIAWQIVMGRLG